jgi:hypothetical protein
VRDQKEHESVEESVCHVILFPASPGLANLQANRSERDSLVQKPVGFRAIVCPIAVARWTPSPSGFKLVLGRVFLIGDTVWMVMGPIR